MKLKASDRNLLVVIIVLILAVIAGCMFMEYRISVYQNSLVRQNAQLTQLENDLAVKKAQADASKDQVIQQATGMSAERKSKDDKIAYDFMFDVLTWNGASEFNSKRTEIMEKYKLGANDRFMNVFLAPMPYTADTADMYNCQLSSMSSLVSGISGTDYSYFSEVEAIARGPNGVTSTLHLIFMYTIDADGNISNLDAFDAAG